ncbi:thiolase-like protein [Schizophyllum fasciatum]
MARRTFIVGVGCTQFIKPRGTRTTEDLGLEAATKALLDAGLTYDAVDSATVGYCYGDSTSGQRALYSLGLTRIPIANVNNNCATGSTALVFANSAVRFGDAECALALGFERMAPGSLGSVYKDRPNPMALWGERTAELERDPRLGANHGPPAPREFDNAAREYFAKYGGDKTHLAKIAAKNHQNAVNNPYAQFRAGWTEEKVLAAQSITATLTKYMCSPTSDGAACCIVASEAFVRAHHLENQAIEIVAQSTMTDGPETFGDVDTPTPAMDLIGYSMTKACADKVFATANASRDEVGVVELHDCFAANELVTYAALGLCAPHDACGFVERGDFKPPGKYAINPSGGLEAKGHPLGATGLAMCFYIVCQLRNWAGPMQVPGLFDVQDPRGKYGLVHNIGLGGAVVVTLLRRPDFWAVGGEDGRDRLTYNHAHVVRPVTRADVERVRARTRGQGSGARSDGSTCSAWIESLFD